MKKKITFIFSKCRNIFKKKIIDYGSSWRILRISSLTDQIFIKAYAIRKIEEKGIDKKKYNIIKNSLIDIINYSIIALIQLKFQKKINPLILEISYKESIKNYDKQIKISKKIMKKKNSHYNEAWKKMNLSSIIDIILQKIFRLKKMENNKQKVLISEPPKGSYIDIINYAIFSLIKLKKIKKEI